MLQSVSKKLRIMIIYIQNYKTSMHHTSSQEQFCKQQLQNGMACSADLVYQIPLHLPAFIKWRAGRGLVHETMHVLELASQRDSFSITIK